MLETLSIKIFKNICAECNIYNFSIDSWRRAFGYHYYQKYQNLFFFQWYLGQNIAEQAPDYIDVHDPMSSSFKQGWEF